MSEPVINLSPHHPVLKTEPGERPSTPDANCAICLEAFINKSVTNACFHAFCYLCLKEWSKIKPECPLCKTTFHTIYYNIRSREEYEEYHIEPQFEPSRVILDQLQFSGRDIRIDNHITATFFRNSFHLGERETFDRFLIPDVPDANIVIMHRPIRPPAPHPFHRRFIADCSNITLNGANQRRDVYRHNRWVRPHPFETRARECSPEFYRANPAATHRLVPWLARELHVLLDVSIDPQVILSDILSVVTTHPIRSSYMRSLLRPVMGDHTDHFIHEFTNFATSPHEMASYDLVAEYDPVNQYCPLQEPPFTTRSSSASDDSDVEVVQSNRPSYVSCGIDLTRPGPSRAFGFPSTSRSSPVVIEISDATSSDSEIEIIHVKPPTPIVITIPSSDSDPEADEEISGTGRVEDTRCDRSRSRSRSLSISRSRSTSPICDTNASLRDSSPHSRKPPSLSSRSTRSSSSRSSSSLGSPPKLRAEVTKRRSSMSSNMSTSSRSNSSLSSSSGGSSKRRNVRTRRSSSETEKKVYFQPSSSSPTSTSTLTSDSDELIARSSSKIQSARKRTVKQTKHKKRAKRVCSRPIIDDSSSDEENSMRGRLRSVVKRVKSGTNSSHSKRLRLKTD